MAEFLVESYVPRTDADGVAGRSERAREAASAMNREGCSVRFVRSIFVPEEEMAFYVFEAASADEVRDAAQRAAIEIESVVEAITHSSSVADDARR